MEVVSKKSNGPKNKLQYLNANYNLIHFGFGGGGERFMKMLEHIFLLCMYSKYKKECKVYNFEIKINDKINNNNNNNRGRSC